MRESIDSAAYFLILIIALFTSSALILSIDLAYSAAIENSTFDYLLEPESTTRGDVWAVTNTSDHMLFVAAEVTENTYALDNEDMAIMAWNILNKRGERVTLVYGNLSANGESVLRCNRLWVASDTTGISIDGGQIYTDRQHREGYRVSSPDKYELLKDAVDDLREAETTYADALNTYNAVQTTEAYNDVVRAQIVYSVSNERVVNLVK